jgi:hypothetical protein
VLYFQIQTGNNNVALGYSALFYNTTGNYNVALGQNALRYNTSGNTNTGLGYNVQTGDFSGSTILGAGAAATANGQLALGSPTYPIGPIVSEVISGSTHTLSINLNGNTYRLLMTQ